MSGEYDVIFLHVQKQHIYENVAGACAAGLRTAFVAPLYNSGSTKALLSRLPGRLGAYVRAHGDPKLETVEIKTTLPWALARIFVNYGWKRGESRLFRRFDQWCAARIRSGRFKARIYYVFQDYLPLTCAAARETGAMLVAEQILNNSVSAQERVINSTRLVSFQVKCPEYPLPQEVNGRLLRMADRVLVPSSYVRSGIQDAVPAERIWHIPYGANPARASRDSAAPGERGRIVVAVWASSVRKGGHLLLEALLSHTPEQLFPGHDGDVQFDMLGNIDPQFLPAIDRIRAKGSRIKITHGFIPHAEVPKKLATSHFFLCPSLSEGMSLAILEAAGVGLPLVITQNCGVDAFVDGAHGVLIADMTPAGVAAAIRTMFSQRDQWPRLGLQARTIIEAHPWAEFRRQLGARLQSLIT